MRSQLRFATFVMMAAAIGATSCSKAKGKSQAVNIAILPEKPTVFNFDYKYVAVNGQDVTATKPWFEIQSIAIENTSDSYVTIINLSVEVTGYDASGNIATATSDYAAGINNFENTDFGLKCNYTDFGEFSPSGTANSKGYIGLVPSSTSIETPPRTCPSYALHFPIGGNPKPASTTGQIRYTVKVKLVGYFGPRDKPEDRFENYVTLYTQ